MAPLVLAASLTASIANDTGGHPDAETLRQLAWAAMRAPMEERYAAWERVVEADPASRAAACATLKMAEVRQVEGRLQEAIPLVARARDMDAWVAPEAQWRLALALVKAGDYPTALIALRRSKRELPRATFGFGHHYKGAYALWEGFVLEHLGEVEEAIGYYLHVYADTRVMAHLLDLYEGAGQLDDLERIVTELSSRSVGAYTEAVPALTLLVLRHVARAGEWATLIPFLQSRALAYPWGSDPANSPVQTTEAFKLLTRSCVQTVPLLLSASWQRESTTAHPWIFHALGVCGTPDAVRALREIALNERGGPASLARLALGDSEGGRAALVSMGLEPLVHRPPQPTGSQDPRLVFPDARSTHLPSHPQLADHTVRAPEFSADAACVW